MKQYSTFEKVKLFRTLFKGREDVFAIYWGKIQNVQPVKTNQPNLLPLPGQIYSTIFDDKSHYQPRTDDIY